MRVALLKWSRYSLALFQKNKNEIRLCMFDYLSVQRNKNKQTNKQNLFLRHVAHKESQANTLLHFCT